MSSNYTITRLKAKDIPAVIELVNSAYRGEISKKGWTTEADIISGNVRIDLQSIQSMLDADGAAILTCFANDRLFGCVYLKPEGTGLYLGMLSVSPEVQGLGIGKKLLEASEEFAMLSALDHIQMTVIDIRHELIAWYQRHGYKNTGERKPFPDDDRFGKPKLPIQFIVMKKMISVVKL
ncbi:GNAT family N-acetyltransferase [soil metagenome]